MNTENEIIVGIDATNIRGGGGVTHLVELLANFSPEGTSIGRVVIWGNKTTLAAIDNQPWIVKQNPTALDMGLFRRTLWQSYSLSKAARDIGCDVLFVPGGSYAGNFPVVVTMSQNLLPFEMREVKRYGFSLRALKLIVLRLTQSRTFQKADGIIFLTKYARDIVLKVTGKLNGLTCTIPHGVTSIFTNQPRPQKLISNYDEKNSYRILYVSAIDQYKHQQNAVEAIAALRELGMPIVLDLVGPSYGPSLKGLIKCIRHFDCNHKWVHYHGGIPFNELQSFYFQADLGLFASSCENMPNILLEMMTSGLPIACSNLGPMPEVLGDAGVYFNPERPEQIADALNKLIQSPQLRVEYSQASHRRSQQFSWQQSANQTFTFIVDVWRKKRGL